jgi:hypothetical protein
MGLQCVAYTGPVSGQTLPIRKASTPEKDAAELYVRLGLSDQVVKPVSSWTDSLASD